MTIPSQLEAKNQALSDLWFKKIVFRQFTLLENTLYCGSKKPGPKCELKRRWSNPHKYDKYGFEWSLDSTVSIICWPYLAIEFIGIHKKIQGLIKLSCVIRVIVSILNGVLMMIVGWILMFGGVFGYSRYRKSDIGIFIFLVATMRMIYLIFRTWLQFKVFYANRADITTSNNIAELQPL